MDAETLGERTHREGALSTARGFVAWGLVLLALWVMPVPVEDYRLYVATGDDDGE